MTTNHIVPANEVELTGIYRIFNSEELREVQEQMASSRGLGCAMLEEHVRNMTARTQNNGK